MQQLKIMKKKLSLLIIIVLLTTIACSKDEQNTTAELTFVSQASATNAETTFTSTKIKGSILGENTNTITSRGVCWSTSPNPTTNNTILTVDSNTIDALITNLNPGTTYFFRLFAIRNNETFYGENISLNTLSFENTTWKFSSYYSPNNFLIESTINFYADGTTKFDEIGPGQGFFITYGTWSLNGTVLTYIFEGDNPNQSTYVYTGTLSGLTMQGTFTHPSAPGTWTAVPLD